MKRRLSALALSLLLLSALAPSATAAGNHAFVPVRSYAEEFTDMDSSDWFYSNVQALYELGLTNGQGDAHTFAPGDDITLAEAVTLAARLRSLYEYGESETGPAMYGSGGAWYRPYADYLKSLGGIGEEFEGSYESAATRAQTAHILAGALPHSLFADINGDAVAVGYASHSYIRDVTDYTPYQRDILLLYKWGILSGMDHSGSFLPDEPIQRCQVAAMVTRLAYEHLRITLNWDLSLAYSCSDATWEGLVTSDGTFYTAPDPGDSAAIDADVRYMLSRGERRIVLSYEPGSLSNQTTDQLMSAFLNAVRHYVEQGYNAVKCTSSVKTGSVVLTFSSSLYSDRLLDGYREATLEAAIQVHDQLWSEGVMTPAMTEYERARAYFTWLCEHCQYDFQSTDTSMSHSGYGAFVEQLAVCDGYTAAYNLLLKLEGIECTTYSTTDHIWTVARLDGTVYHIDPTWGDQTGVIAYRYFGMTESASLARFP